MPEEEKAEGESFLLDFNLRSLMVIYMVLKLVLNLKQKARNTNKSEDHRQNQMSPKF